MRSTLARTSWAVLIAIYAGFTFTVYIFGRTQVAPCLAGWTAPDLQRRCAQAWFESRPLILKMLDTPIPAIVLFVLLIAGTAWLTRARTQTANQAG